MTDAGPDDWIAAGTPPAAAPTAEGANDWVKPPSGTPPASEDGGAGAFGYGVLKATPFGTKTAAAGTSVTAALMRKLDQLGLLNEDQKKALAGLPEDYGSASTQMAARGEQEAAAHPYWYAAGTALPMIMAPGQSTFKGAMTYGGLLGAGEGEDIPGSVAHGALGALGGALGLGAAKAFTPAAGAVRSAVLEAAKNLGVTMPRYSVGLPITQMAGKIGFSVPGAAAPLEEATRESIEGLGSAAERAAAGATKESAGAAASAGLKNWIGPVSDNIVNQRYAYANGLMRPGVQSPLTDTVGAFNQLAAKRGAYGEQMTGPVAKLINDANSVPGGLTYDAMKNLRTRLDTMSSSWGQIGPKELDDAEIARLHGALSNDLNRAAMRAGGPQAVAAHNVANNTYKTIADNRKQLTSLLGGPQGDASNEAVFWAIKRVAGETSAANVALLQRARAAIPAQHWDELSRGMVSTLGRDIDGNFSPLRFMTDYGKISPAAKNELFAGNTPLRQNLDDLATVSEQWKKLGRYANPSGTAGHGAGIGMALEGAHHPVEVLGTFLGAKAMGKFLASPAGAGAASTWVRAMGSGNADMIRNAATRVSATAGAQLGARVDPVALGAFALQHYLPEHQTGGAGDSGGGGQPQ